MANNENNPIPPVQNPPPPAVPTESTGSSTTVPSATLREREAKERQDQERLNRERAAVEGFNSGINQRGVRDTGLDRVRELEAAREFQQQVNRDVIPGQERTPEQVEEQRRRSNEAENRQNSSDAVAGAQQNLFQRARQQARQVGQNDAARTAAQFTPNDLFARPKIGDLKGFSYEPATVDVATATQIDAIQNDFLAAGVPAATLTFAVWDLARFCADAGCSEFTEMVNISSYSGNVTRAELAAIVKNHCTLRRFCGFYAKIVWNIMLESKIPPSNWIKKGYKENTKFAAFDFFTSVSSHAALEPQNGLIRRPYHEEIIAHQTNKGVALHRQEAQKDKSASTVHEITGGRTGPRARLLLKPAGN